METIGSSSSFIKSSFGIRPVTASSSEHLFVKKASQAQLIQFKKISFK